MLVASRDRRRGRIRITATGLTGCLCLSVANPPKSQSTLSDTGIPLQTSVSHSLHIHSTTNKRCCGSGVFLIHHYTACRRVLGDRSSQLPTYCSYFFHCMTFMIQFHLWNSLHAFVLIFLLDYILYLRLLAAIQSDLKPEGREECITLLKGISTGHTPKQMDASEQKC